ncbi:MAG: hypothetical protein ACHQAQ_06245 [Hyphomicrobiales bacterium]
MSAHIEEAHDWSAQLRLWEQAKLRRDLVFTELTQRLALQAESDGRLLLKLEKATARLSGAGEKSPAAPRRLALAWTN